MIFRRNLVDFSTSCPSN